MDAETQTRAVSPAPLYFYIYIVGRHHLHAWCPQRPEEGVRASWLELQMVMSCHVGAENWTWLLHKSSHCSHLLSCLSRLRDDSLILSTWGSGGKWKSSRSFSLLESKVLSPSFLQHPADCYLLDIRGPFISRYRWLSIVRWEQIFSNMWTKSWAEDPEITDPGHMCQRGRSKGQSRAQP